MGDSDWPNFRPSAAAAFVFSPVDLRVDSHEGTSSDWSDYADDSVEPITLLLDERFVRTRRGSNGRIAVLITYSFSQVVRRMQFFNYSNCFRLILN